MRFAIGVEYDGSAFLGWQVQRQEPTVQSCVEQALSRVADHPVQVTCCGRTDTGVHAVCQVVHFDTHATRSERSWVLGVNANLPSSVCALWMREVDETFHARFSAYSRTYRYEILNRWVKPAIDARRVSWCRKPLNTDKMHDASQFLLGEHDFSAFRAASCQARHAVREIQEISVSRNAGRVIIDVTANGFLYHMVRNIAGSLISVGTGEHSVEWVQQVLNMRDRSLAAPTAAAGGLYFMRGRYPEKYDLPAGEVDFPRGWDRS